jgi:hypothetical protein
VDEAQVKTQERLMQRIRLCRRRQQLLTRSVHSQVQPQSLSAPPVLS